MLCQRFVTRTSHADLPADCLSQPVSFQRDLNDALGKALPSQMTLDVKVTPDYPYIRVEVSYSTVIFLSTSSADCTLQSKETEDGIAFTFRRCKYKPGHFPFLDLPIEIRNMIYRLCLYQPSPVVIFFKSTIAGKKECNVVQSYYGNAGRVGQILRVNRLIYREALPVALSANSFCLDNFAQLRMFLDIVGSTGRICLTKLEFEWVEGNDSCLELEKCLLLLTQCSKLRRLEVTVSADELHRDRRMTSKRCKALLTTMPSLKLLTIEYDRQAYRAKQFEQALRQMLGTGGILIVTTELGGILRTEVVP